MMSAEEPEPSTLADRVRAANRDQLVRARSVAAALHRPNNVPPRKWTSTKKVFTKKLNNILKEIDKHDDASMHYFHDRIEAKLEGGVSAAMIRCLHKHVGL